MREHSKGASRLFTTRTRPDQSMQHAMLEFAAELHPARKRNDAPIRPPPDHGVREQLKPFQEQKTRRSILPSQ
jgi:hypothetical protein